MLGLLKNLFFSALMVVGATMATACVVSVVVTPTAAQEATAPPGAGMIPSVLSLAIIGAMLAGFSFRSPRCSWRR